MSRRLRGYRCGRRPRLRRRGRRTRAGRSPMRRNLSSSSGRGPGPDARPPEPRVAGRRRPARRGPCHASRSCVRRRRRRCRQTPAPDAGGRTARSTCAGPALPRARGSRARRRRTPPSVCLPYPGSPCRAHPPSGSQILSNSVTVISCERFFAMFAFSTLSNVSTLRRVRLEEVALVSLLKIRQLHVYEIPHLDSVPAHAGNAVVRYGSQRVLKIVPSLLLNGNEKAYAPFAKQTSIGSASAFALDQAFDHILLIDYSKATG